VLRLKQGSEESVLELTRRKKIIYTLAALAGLAVGIELAVRLVCWAAGRVPYTAATPWCIADDDLLYVFRPHYEGRIFEAVARVNDLGLRGDDFATSKPKGTRRVLCLGDSRTFGYQVAQDECFPAQLERIWREKFPGSPIEVLNAGLPGYSSYQGLHYLELKGLRFDPDVVTVAFGFNDRRFVLKPEQADGAQWFREAARGLRSRSRLRFSYALLGVAKMLSRARSEDTWRRDVLALPSQRLDALSCRVDLDAYRRNLRQIAATCRTRRIPLVFILMGDSPAVEQPFQDGIRLRSEKRYDEAIAAFLRIGRMPADLATEQWCRALVLYEIGLTRAAQGRTSEALAVFRESAQAAAHWSVFGGTPIRHARDYVEAMRQVAAELQAPCLDIAAQFAQRPDLFADYTHHNAQGHRLIAEALADFLTNQTLLEPLAK
jgi:lysophospholipase L1-like esterase